MAARNQPKYRRWAHGLWGLCLAIAWPLAGRAAEPMIVSSITPEVASPGHPVTISGQGLHGETEDFFAWVETAASGFAFYLESSRDSEIHGRVGRAAIPATGSVRLWRGYSHSLPDHTLLSRGKLVSILDTRLFVAREKATGPTFSTPTASARTLSSQTAAGNLIIVLDPIEPISPEDPPPAVRITAVIETGGSSGGGPANRTAPPPGWAMMFMLETGAALSADDFFADTLADVLNEQFGALGITAMAQGEVLVVSHPSEIRAGFLTISY